MTTKFTVRWPSGLVTHIESETKTLEALAMERWGRLLTEVEDLGVKLFEGHIDPNALASVSSPSSAVGGAAEDALVGTEATDGTDATAPGPETTAETSPGANGTSPGANEQPKVDTSTENSPESSSSDVKVEEKTAESGASDAQTP
jgi:hypothetical protein